MQLSSLDWSVLGLYGLAVISLGLIHIRKVGSNTEEYFLAGRSMTWWLLGTSMVATTFSSDTPNLVSDLVRNGGVSQNWIWWAFVITGMCTVFFYAKLWRRSEVITDIGFYELRYSGKKAAFLKPSTTSTTVVPSPSKSPLIEKMVVLSLILVEPVPNSGATSMPLWPSRTRPSYTACAV